jgi:hypothetical protein
VIGTYRSYRLKDASNLDTKSSNPRPVGSLDMEKSKTLSDNPLIIMAFVLEAIALYMRKGIRENYSSWLQCQEL